MIEDGSGLLFLLLVRALAAQGTINIKGHCLQIFQKLQLLFLGTTMVNIPPLFQVNITFELSGLKARVRLHTCVYMKGSPQTD